MDIPNTTPEVWQVDVNGQIYEANFEELQQWIAEGALLPQDKVRRGNLRWLEAGKIPVLYGFFNAKELGATSPPVVTMTSGANGAGEAVENPAGGASTGSFVLPQTTAQGATVQHALPPPPPVFNQSDNYQNANYQPQYQSAGAFQPTNAEVADEVKSGANWFFWIAGLSLVNSLIIFFGGQWAFIAGLAFTQVIDAVVLLLATESGLSAIHFIGLILDLAIAGVFAGFGYFARRGVKWAFIVGMILYALDGGLYLLGGSIFAVAIHAFALYSLWKGFQSCND